MIGSFFPPLQAAPLVLALLAGPTDAMPDAAAQIPSLEIDPCVAVDESAVGDLIELELRGERGPSADVPLSVAVRCIDGGQEIRVEPWASRGEEGIRPIQLPPADDADPAAREARSRELALAIAELIRRLAITHPVRSEPPPPPPPPPVVVAPAPPPDERPGRWRVAVLSSFDHFSGGQSLAGGDVSVAASMGRWWFAELRAGGRLAGDETLPSGQLTARAGTAAAGAGLNLWSARRKIGFALVLRAQGYLVEYEAASSGDGGGRSTVLGAVVVAAAPQLFVAISRRISLAAGAAAGVPLHGIVVRIQGTETHSLTGLALSGNLGAVLTF